MEKDAIKRAILAKGYIADERLWTMYSVYDLGSELVGLHRIHEQPIYEHIQQCIGIDEQTMGYGGSIPLEQVEQLADIFAQLDT